MTNRAASRLRVMPLTQSFEPSHEARKSGLVSKLVASHLLRMPCISVGCFCNSCRYRKELTQQAEQAGRRACSGSASNNAGGTPSARIVHCGGTPQPPNSRQLLGPPGGTVSAPACLRRCLCPWSHTPGCKQAAVVADDP